jgi:hypothetical protein
MKLPRVGDASTAIGGGMSKNFRAATLHMPLLSANVQHSGIGLPDLLSLSNQACKKKIPKARCFKAGDSKYI